MSSITIRLSEHEERNADITVVYQKRKSLGFASSYEGLTIGEAGRVTSASLTSDVGTTANMAVMPGYQTQIVVQFNRRSLSPRRQQFRT